MHRQKLANMLFSMAVRTDADSFPGFAATLREIRAAAAKEAADLREPDREIDTARPQLRLSD